MKYYSIRSKNRNLNCHLQVTFIIIDNYSNCLDVIATIIFAKLFEN